MQKGTIGFIGDTHSSQKDCDKAISIIRNEYPDVDAFIQVGDYGYFEIGHGMCNYKPPTKKPFYCIRGNHDNPKFWESTYTDHNGVTYVKDGSILSVAGWQILFLGGAESMDQEARIKRMQERQKEGKPYYCDWFEDEGISDEALTFSMRSAKIDIIVTHDCPLTIGEQLWHKGVTHHMPQEKYGRKTRFQLQKLMDKHKPEYWVFGHHHGFDIGKVGKTNYALCPDSHKAQRGDSPFVVIDGDGLTVAGFKR